VKSEQEELTLSKENHEVAKAPESQASALTTKKLFVEPEVSGPVDVLEATNFFQVSSGTTDPVVP
jgi:hypothetical protein